MSARSFKSVGWVAGIGAAALTCYMFSLSVAAERAELAELNTEIVELRQSIRTLNTELETRGRVHQLQHWASADFGFTAPAAGQFLESEVTLAQLELRSETSPMETPVRMANAPQPAPAMPRVVQASAPSAVTAPSRPAVAVPAQQRTDQQPLLRQASMNRATAAGSRPATRPATASAARPAAMTTQRPAAQVAAQRTATVRATPTAPRATSRPPSLLDDRTLRELSSRERSERGDRSARGGR